jgi:hypothetical protein
LKNNERLAHHAKEHPNDLPPEDVTDQGFTRPSVLILLPFRNSALRWMSALTSHTPAPTWQVENRARFETEYGLPSGAIDKLATAEKGTYPDDHVETFSGNVDDSFRLGVKMTRKSVKLFAEFYGCDLIVASPLGLRMSIEKEGYVICSAGSIYSLTIAQECGLPVVDRNSRRRPDGRTNDAELGPCTGRAPPSPRSSRKTDSIAQPSSSSTT